MDIKHSRCKVNKKILLKLIIVFLLLIFLSGSIYCVHKLLTTRVAPPKDNNANVAPPQDNSEDKKLNKKDSMVYISLPGAAKIPAIVEDYNITGSIWMLVNKTNPISTNYIPSVSILSGFTDTNKGINEQSIRTDIHKHSIDLFNSAAAAGYQLMIGSGYRSAATQSSILQREISIYGEEAAKMSVAQPGQSEHQTGLAVDIVPSSRDCYIQECFKDMPEGIWLAENAHKFGFILRYPSGKEGLTGYGFEPWHFRFVGIDLATALYESGLTLEESWPYLQSARQSLINNNLIKIE